MTNKTKIIDISVATVLFVGVAGSALAYNHVCTTPEAQMIRKAAQTDPAIEAKLASLPILERVEAQICTLRKLSPKEAAAITAKKKADPGFTPSPDASPLSPVTLGIQNAIDPTVLGESLMLGTNSWKGYVNGTLVSVGGTAEKSDPSQGVLFVWELATTTASGIGSTWTYPTPIATGPLKIVSEAGGIITAVSLAGTYEAYNMDTNTRHNVTTAGGTTYTFDVASRRFR